MPLKERVYSILVVSPAEKFNTAIKSMLPEAEFSPVKFVKSVGEARRRILEQAFDIVLINTPLPDEFGTRLAIDLCTESGVGTLLFVRSELYDDIYEKVTDYGVLTISKPTSAAIIMQSIRLLCGTRERLRRMEKKTASVEEKIEEIRLVNRAKWILIDELKMTETDAHRYIEKQAMDRCVTRRKIAEGIIQTYK
ncbi:MAG: ANTAR domain-containing protein [Clostridiales bacterium]|nr:ANTAR domain-containing protein [Clostridiales bacterium]